MSIVNHNFKHAFIHIPKTAGHSMQTQNWVGRTCHTSALEFQQAGMWRDDYVSWTFVRNPYDRMVSSYEWARKTWNKMWRIRFGVTLDDLSSFEKYVSWVERTGGHKNDNRPQTDFIVDKDGNLTVDFIGRFENLENDWNHVCEMVLGRTSPLPHKNKTNRRPTDSYYTDDLKKRVFGLYREDFKNFY